MYKRLKQAVTFSSTVRPKETLQMFLTLSENTFEVIRITLLIVAIENLIVCTFKQLL